MRWTTTALVVRLVVGVCFVSLVTGCGPAEKPVDKHVAKQVGPLEEDQGKKRFESYCATCHQSGGDGIAGRVPPLTDSPWVAGPESRLIRIVLHGLRGPIEIHGKSYNMEMPGFHLYADEEIASLLSYVRKQYGTPSRPITAAAVGRVRAATQDHSSYWTVDELLEVR